ncbi:MAG TPA: chromate efflux transporter [Candidatus Polarisedimenticolaceae bacterium]|nr:chromate efflux transporter [Candidatus Polarisedimenticolaceae bacterium]
MRRGLFELAKVFLKLGTTAFGGPAAHIAMMRDEIVRRRRWLSEQQFLDLISATNLIPGPNSTEMAIHVGHARAGWRGLLVAGVCFILPATLIVWGLAHTYVRWGTLPEMEAVFYGVKPVIIAIIARALVGLGRTAVKSVWLGLLGAGSMLAVALGLHEIAVLSAAGLLTLGGGWLTRRRASGNTPLLALPAAVAAGTPTPVRAALLAGAGGSIGGATAIGLGKLFLVFLKAGALLFGSGYVLLAFLRADLVERLGWLTEKQLLDAIAVGQITPGPVFTTATFVGFVLGGSAGALVATVGIFLPAFVYVAASAPIVPRLRRSRLAAAALDGLNVASLALMIAVTWHLARASLQDPVAIGLAVLSLLVLATTRVNSVWLVLAGGIVGFATNL